MPTDDERRDVAEAIRRIKDTREGCGRELCCDLWAALNPECPRCSDMCDECEVSVLDDVADLIEPSVDRDALLELADEMYESGRHYGEQIENAVTSDIIDDAPGEFRDYARRIREALGADDG